MGPPVEVIAGRCVESLLARMTVSDNNSSVEATRSAAKATERFRDSFRMTHLSTYSLTVSNPTALLRRSRMRHRARRRPGHGGSLFSCLRASFGGVFDTVDAGDDGEQMSESEACVKLLRFQM